MEFPLFLSIGLILFTATTVVRIAGFGGSLVAMPLLLPLIGLSAGTAVMTLFGITTFSVVLSQNWRLVTIRAIWRLALMSVLFTPLGIYALWVVPEWMMRLLLGVVCILFALYRLSKLPFPSLKNPNWGWLFGMFAGIGAGAFSVGGVPAVIYANTQDWEPEPFRLNMFSYFLIANCFTLITRTVAGQMTRSVIGYWLGAVPFLLAGIWIGERLARRVDKQRFQTLVLVLLIVLGGRLVLSAL